MSLSVIKRTPFIKRIPTFIDRTDGIQRYDRDNLYPQRIEEVLNRSFTVNAASQKLSEFLTGQGFEDEALNSVVLNEKNQTGKDILNDVCRQSSIYKDSFALHVGYNLNGHISSINPIKFKYNRLSIPEKNGIVTKIKYSTNWENDPHKEPSFRRQIIEYDVYNPDPSVVREQIRESGGINNYLGQIYYYTPNKEYPKSTFDPVIDHAQTQNEMGVYSLTGIQERWVGTTLFKYPGRFKDDDEKKEVERRLEVQKGAEGKRVLVAENPDGIAENLIETITAPNEDKLFEFTSRDVKNSIMENYAMPKEILGVLPESGMFNQENMQNAYLYYNTVTAVPRDRITRVLNELFSNWFQQLPESKIKPLEYGVPNQSE